MQEDCSEDGYDAESELCFGHTREMKRQCTFTVNRFRYNHRDMFRVRCRSVGGESPVGSRLHRGEPMPEVKDAYESQEDAEKAAAKMQEYHDRFEAKRGKRKRRKR